MRRRLFLDQVPKQLNTHNCTITTHAASPRRSQALSSIGLQFTVVNSTFDENLDKSIFKKPGTPHTNSHDTTLASHHTTPHHSPHITHHTTLHYRHILQTHATHHTTHRTPDYTTHLTPDHTRPHTSNARAPILVNLFSS